MYIAVKKCADGWDESISALKTVWDVQTSKYIQLDTLGRRVWWSIDCLSPESYIFLLYEIRDLMSLTVIMEYKLNFFIQQVFI